MPDIHSLREEINRTDIQITEAFIRRMNTALEIAKYKQANGLPVHDPIREREVRACAVEQCPPELRIHVELLYNTLFDVSRSYQQCYLSHDTGAGDHDGA